MRIVSGNEKGIAASVARGAFSMFSGLYRLVYEGKSISYRLGLKRSRRVNARVVSVGNITAGGAGKTPAVMYFARRFLEEGRNIVVLSRGYGRVTPADQPLAVSDRSKVLLSPRESGDEPYLIARKLSGVPVVVCGKRVKGARFAIEKFGAEVIVLDDGFQHVALARDEDIVVIDCTAPFGYGRLLPRGLLREPIDALKRATCFLLTRADERGHEDVVNALRGINPDARLLKSRHRPKRLINLQEQTEMPCGSISKKRVIALSSIGNPAAFEKTVSRLGAHVAQGLRFSDHHWYDPADIEKIQSIRERLGAEYVVTTEKDGVRLGAVSRPLGNTLLLEIELEII
ncbi:MAG: tetraacyldisaccharide 4'-kinase [Candidatus Lindowbacteria bacterium]|nr:tetraacyldisaccharide 4'-kinase [Candidatus Lindowbacteria bacterium]